MAAGRGLPPPTVTHTGPPPPPKQRTGPSSHANPRKKMQLYSTQYARRLRLEPQAQHEACEALEVVLDTPREEPPQRAPEAPARRLPPHSQLTIPLGRILHHARLSNDGSGALLDSVCRGPCAPSGGARGLELLKVRGGAGARGAAGLERVEVRRRDPPTHARVALLQVVHRLLRRRAHRRAHPAHPAPHEARHARAGRVRRA
mmetsp:Transcript_10764/g.26361  ORF Transcript_10764/g.26361 Transcript_10764/m.26361 type:complete len:203 (+) Transcript_10764:196-804(+)